MDIVGTTYIDMLKIFLLSYLEEEELKFSNRMVQ